jgi:hypothetical protein
MGLYCTHGAFRGSYGSFNRLRQFILESIGGLWTPNCVYGGSKYYGEEELDPELWYTDPDVFDIKPKKGLIEFFNHSDCGGEIKPEMCKILADELEEILPFAEKYAEKVEAKGQILFDGGYVAVIKKFIDGCRLAYKNNEPLEFG